MPNNRFIKTGRLKTRIDSTAIIGSSPQSANTQEDNKRKRAAEFNQRIDDILNGKEEPFPNKETNLDKTKERNGFFNQKETNSNGKKERLFYIYANAFYYSGEKINQLCRNISWETAEKLNEFSKEYSKPGLKKNMDLPIEKDLFDKAMASVASILAMKAERTSSLAP